MGTTVSNLQCLGVSEEAVRAALPQTLVGQWSERFVTACFDMSFSQLDRKAGALSKKLACTVLAVSMFDGDALDLHLYRDGRMLTRHCVDPETGACFVGNPKRFCEALELPEELAPKLKHLFAACAMQEDKLDILQALLGTPLYVRSDFEPPTERVQADLGPLEDWYRNHPEPPKIKNQYRAELIQELPDRAWDYFYPNSAVIFHGVSRAENEEEARDFGCNIGDILGESSENFWARTLPDGRLELIPLEKLEITQPLMEYLFDRDDMSPSHFCFASLGERLVTAATFDTERDYGAYAPFQTVVLRDTAGILPCCLPLTLDGRPVTADELHLLNDGGFLAAVGSALLCYGPDGTQRWVYAGTNQAPQVMEGRIYVRPGRLSILDTDGVLIAESPIAYAYDAHLHLLGNTPYVLESCGYREDYLLHRLTPDLQPDGEIFVPYMSSLALSPDGTLLYAAGFESGLRVISAASLDIICDLPRRANFDNAVADSQNRLWVGNGSYFECYTPELECVSRHRLKGEICWVYRNDAGQACAVTYQQSKYIIRVYRFS